MKILVIGFQRSGTTLLKDLIWKHPQVKHMFHEVALAKFQKDHLMNSLWLPDKSIRNNYQGTSWYRKEIDFDLDSCTWGEKVPYWMPKISKGFNGPVGKYCSIWNQYFRNEARILHIIRHPLDVGISTKKRGFTRGVRRPVNQYKKVLPVVLKQFKTFGIKNILHVQFENLVTKPKECLMRIYKFCGLGNGEKLVRGVINNKNIFRFKKINPERAFSHKESGRNPERYDLDEIINFLNTIKGIRY